MLGLVLIKIFINDLEEAMKCTLILSADDTELGSIYARAGLPDFRAGFRDGTSGTLLNSTRRNAKLCP